jgi:ribosomal protein S8E
MPKNTVENHAFFIFSRKKGGKEEEKRKKKKKRVGRKQKPLRQSGETSPQGVRRFFRELLVSNHKVRGEKGVSDK